MLDVVFFHPISKSDLVRTYPRLFNGTHTTHPAYEHHRVREVTVAAPGIVAYADGERLGPLPLTVTAVPQACWSRSVSAGMTSIPVRALREVPGASSPRRCCRLPRSSTTSRSTTSRCGPATPSRTATGAGGGADRVRQDAGRRVRRPPRPRSGAASASTPRRSRPCRNQKYADLVSRYGSDKVGLLTGDNIDQRRGPDRRDDDRGAAQHAVRRFAAPCSASAYVVMDEVHYLADRIRGAVWEEVHHPPARVGRGGVAVGDRVATPRSSATGWRRSAATPSSSLEEKRPVPLLPARDGGPAAATTCSPGRRPPGRRATRDSPVNPS